MLDRMLVGLAPLTVPWSNGLDSVDDDWVSVFDDVPAAARAATWRRVRMKNTHEDQTLQLRLTSIDLGPTSGVLELAPGDPAVELTFLATMRLQAKGSDDDTTMNSIVSDFVIGG